MMNLAGSIPPEFHYLYSDSNPGHFQKLQRKVKKLPVEISEYEKLVGNSFFCHTFLLLDENVGTFILLLMSKCDGLLLNL